MSRQRLVNGIVRHFEYHVMQAGTVIGIANIHAGALAHGIQPFENLDGIGAIFAHLDGFFRGIFSVF